MRLTVSISLFCAAHLLTASTYLTSAATKLLSVLQSTLIKFGLHAYFNAVLYLSKLDGSACVSLSSGQGVYMNVVMRELCTFDI
jgi:hypothetical protein